MLKRLAIDWLIFAKVQIFQLVWFARITRYARQTPETLNLRRVMRVDRIIRTASFARIAPQDVYSRLCIDLTCKSLALNASFASGVNAP